MIPLHLSPQVSVEMRGRGFLLRTEGRSFAVSNDPEGDWQARLDAEYETSLEFLPKIQAGVRWVDHDAHREGQPVAALQQLA